MDGEQSWGTLLREWREKTMRWSQQELVDRIVQLAYRTNADRGTNLNIGLLQKWENGIVRRPHYSYQRLLAELGAPLPGTKSIEPLSSALSGEGISSAHPLVARRGAPSDPPTIAMIRAMADSFQLADRRLGGGKLYHTVSEYLKIEIAPALLDPPIDCTPDELFSAAASLTEIAGWMAHDGGHDDRARRHFSQAYRLTVAGANPALSANVCASMAHLAIQLNLPDDAERISTAGLNHVLEVEGAEHLIARLHTMRARALAMQGLEHECQEAIEAAHDALASLDDSAPRIGWIAGFDEASLASESAHCFLSLGSLKRAESESRKVVHLRAGDRVRSRTLAQLTLANVLLREGAPEEAARVGLDICATAPALNSARVHSGLARLRQLLASHRASPAVATFLATQAETSRRTAVLGEETRWPV